MNFPDELIRFLRKAERVAALTGAGVSQESGLRTFRDAQTGLWTQYKPTELASPEAYAHNPKLVWDWYAWRREAIKGVRPNPGHYALVDMAHHFSDFSLITQNVDGLHQRAGSRNVIELHDNINRTKFLMKGTSPIPGRRRLNSRHAVLVVMAIFVLMSFGLAKRSRPRSCMLPLRLPNSVTRLSRSVHRHWYNRRHHYR